MFKSPGLWDKFDLYCILGKGNQLFNFIGKFRYLGLGDLSQELMIENYLIIVELLENRTGEITAGAYSHIYCRNCKQFSTNWDWPYILGLIWGTYSIYLFDSHRKDQYDNLSSSGTVVLLKFDSLNSLKNYTSLLYRFTIILSLKLCSFKCKRSLLCEYQDCH